MFVEKNLLIPDWGKKQKNLFCGFTLPVYGNMALTRKSITSGVTTKENRINFLKRFNLNINSIFYPHLIHSDNVIYVDEKNIGLGSVSIDNAVEGDACITDKKNILILITWADCIPILLYEPFAKVIGVVHSGWKGTNLNIVEKTIAMMINKKAKKENIFASIGPGIRNCCYNVGIDFKDIFNNNQYKEFFNEKENKLYFDLTGCVNRQLINAGIDKEKIDFYGKCTGCSTNPKFFSYRKDGKEKFEAQAAFIGMFSNE